MNFLRKSKFKIIAIIFSVLFMSSFNLINVSAQGEVEKADTVYSEFKQEIVTLTNENRNFYKKPELKPSAILMKAAQMKAENMASTSYFAHTSPVGLSPWHWFYEAGYKPSLAGENLALSLSLNGEIVDYWMDSTGHRKNILRDEFKEIGVGVAKGYYKGQEVVFTVQLFGSQEK